VTKTLVVTERLEVWVLPSKATILRIELDRSEEARDRLRQLAAEGKHHGSHVVCVIVKGLVLDHVANVSERLRVLARIERQGGGVKPFLHATWGCLPLWPILAVADIEIELDALVQLLLVGILFQHRTENLGRLAKLVSLKCLEPLFVQGNCLNVRCADDRR
jgi:hypothetical protein